jgi:hypothetical protein
LASVLILRCRASYNSCNTPQNSHYAIVAPVDEESQGIIRVDAANGREETVALGYGVLGASKKGFHPAEVAQGGQAGDVGRRIESYYNRHPSVPVFPGLAARRRSGRALRLCRKRGELTAGGPAHKDHALGVHVVAGRVLLDLTYRAPDIVWSLLPTRRRRKAIIDV